MYFKRGVSYFFVFVWGFSLLACSSIRNPIAENVLVTQSDFLRLDFKDWERSQDFRVYEGDKNSKVVVPEGLEEKDFPVFPALVKPVKIGEETGVDFKVSYLSDDKGSGYEISLPKGCDVYGGGEVKGKLLRNDSDVLLWNKDNFFYIREGGTRLYQSHPWLLCLKEDGTAFGFIFMTSNAARMKVKDDKITFVASKVEFPFLILSGDSPQSVLEDLADWTGKMELPPLWALGYQQCRWSYYPDSRVREIADEFRARNIPCDVIWIDIHYMDEYRIFTFDSNRFPDPRGLNDYLHNKKFHSVWMIDPGVKVDEEYFVCKQGSDLDLWVKDFKGDNFIGKVWPGDCFFPDFSSEKTALWWADLYKDFIAQGIDGVWNDMNEPSVFDGYDSSMPPSNKHRGGLKMENSSVLPEGDHLQYHNFYGMLMVKASKEGLLKSNPNKRPFILSRSNFLGGQRYAATWTGDNFSSQNHFLMSIPMSLSLGLSGQPFNGPDLGGFGGVLSGDLMARWMGVGVFFPFARGHAMLNTNDKEPWEFGKGVEDICRTAIERRYALMPYLYTLFRESSKTGLPVMRPMFMADPKDKSLRGEDSAFMLGQDIIVLPQCNPISKKKISLPKGDWKECKLVGEDTQNIKEHPKLLLRDGSAIPVIKPIQTTVDYSVEDISFICNFDEQNKAIAYLYEDAGDGFGYKNGDFVLTKFIIKKGKDKISYSKKVVEGKRKSEIKNISFIELN